MARAQLIGRKYIGMANQQHYSILNHGVSLWNLWRKEHPDILPDLSGLILIKANLNRANLSRADLNRASLSRIDLIESNLSEANLSGAILYRANLNQTNLSKADLSLAFLVRSEPIRANLRGASLKGANLSNVFFQAEDGIRDLTVTGVQTCALPI